MVVGKKKKQGKDCRLYMWAVIKKIWQNFVIDMEISFRHNNKCYETKACVLFFRKENAGHIFGIRNSDFETSKHSPKYMLNLFLDRTW